MYESRHRADEAVETYRRAVKSNPDNPAFVERLGDLLIRLGRYQEAQAEIEQLAELAPRDARVWMKLGAVHYEQKQWDRAIDAFRTFDIVWTLTGGGPGRSTELFSLYAYVHAFLNLDLGRGSAAAIVGGLIILVIGVVLYRLVDRIAKA